MQLTQRVLQDRRIPLIITGILALWLAIATTQLITELQKPIEQNNLSMPHNIYSYIPPIAPWHLFGRYDEGLANLPSTRLQLILQGTLLDSANPQGSRAIINASGQSAKLYRIGEIIPGGAVIKNIENSRVILNNHGSLESLALPIPKLNQ